MYSSKNLFGDPVARPPLPGDRFVAKAASDATSAFDLPSAAAIEASKPMLDLEDLLSPPGRPASAGPGNLIETGPGLALLTGTTRLQSSLYASNTIMDRYHPVLHAPAPPAPIGSIGTRTPPSSGAALATNYFGSLSGPSLPDLNVMFPVPVPGGLEDPIKLVEASTAGASTVVPDLLPAAEVWDASRPTLVEHRDLGTGAVANMSLVSSSASHIVFDQGSTSACVALAFAAAVALRSNALYGTPSTPSPAYIWWKTRKLQCDLGRHACGCEDLANCGSSACSAADCPTHLETSADVLASGVPSEAAYPWPNRGVWSSPLHQVPPPGLKTSIVSNPFPIDVSSYGAETAFLDLLKRRIPIVLSLSLTPRQVGWFNSSKGRSRSLLEHAVLPLSTRMPHESFSTEGHAFVVLGFTKGSPVNTHPSAFDPPSTDLHFICQDSHGSTSHYGGYFLLPAAVLKENAVIEAFAVEKVMLK